MPEPVPICHILEATTGGTRRHLFDLVMNLPLDRFAPTLIVSALRDREFVADLSAYRAAGIPVHLVPMQRGISPRADLRAAWAIHSLLHKLRFRIVHTHSSKAGALGRWHAPRGTLVVHTPHVFPFQMRVGRLQRALYTRIERRLARNTTRFICVSDCERVAALAADIAPADRFTVIPNGVHPDRPYSVPARGNLRTELGLAADIPIIGGLGRFVPQKGFDVLIEAIAHVREQFPAARLILVGAGPEAGRMERSLRRRGLQDAVCILPPREDVSTFMAAVDVLTIPSRWEGLPYTLLEAMADRKAVVAAAVGGIPEVVEDGNNALLVPPDQPRVLAAAINLLIANPGLRAGLGESAAATIRERYTHRAMVERTLDLYDSLLDAQQLPLELPT